MHIWGTEGVDWKGIEDAAEYIGTNLRRWGRVNVSQWKEKFGTVRVYCNFGWSCLLNVTHPGWMHYGPYPKWLMHLDIYYSRYLLSPLNYVVTPYHRWLYRFLYGRALRKWPHLRAEILHGADWNEELRMYGVHTIRTSSNGYEIRYDWHPDNFKYPAPDLSKEPAHSDLDDEEIDAVIAPNQALMDLLRKNGD